MNDKDEQGRVIGVMQIRKHASRNNMRGNKGGAEGGEGRTGKDRQTSNDRGNPSARVYLRHVVSQEHVQAHSAGAAAGRTAIHRLLRDESASRDHPGSRGFSGYLFL